MSATAEERRLAIENAYVRAIETAFDAYRRAVKAAQVAHDAARAELEGEQ
jgi:hypothetical protein